MNYDNWLTGPVAITGADGHVGRALRGRLADLPNTVRPLGQNDDWEDAMRDAEAVIHLAGTLQPKRPNSYHGANVGTLERYLKTLSRSTVQRIVLLSYVGADPDSANEYLCTKGRAEELVRGSGIPAVILRSTYIYGDPKDIGPSFANYRTAPGGKISVVGDGSQQVAPIQVGDLTELLTKAALDPAAPSGTFEVSGPQTFTLDEFVRSINPSGVTIRHIAGPLAGFFARLTPRLTPAMVDVLVSDSLCKTDPRTTAERFGVALHRFGEPIESSAGTPQ